MTTVLSRKDLPNCTTQFVFVERENAMYHRVGDEYLKKMYFDVGEAASTLGITRDRVHQYCRKLGIQSRANKRKKIRITLTQLRQIAQAQTKL
jgi:hypothetical protein